MSRQFFPLKNEAGQVIGDGYVEYHELPVVDSMQFHGIITDPAMIAWVRSGLMAVSLVEDKL